MWSCNKEHIQKIAPADKKGHELWLVNGPNSFYSENSADIFCGIDRDPSGKTFWYTGKSALFQTIPLGGDQVPIVLTVQGTQDFKAICTSNNGVKYLATSNKMFKYTKSGVSAAIFPGFSFTNITSIAASGDGYRIYVVDNGNIRMISNDAKYPKNIITVLNGQQVAGITLSNSEKYIYFTTTNKTVNKLAL
ncbi:hypothetical protein [Mucilaginibacter psychrotolerans]|uniref:SMP-30/Gluconolactonase/LRE-like region domain-containing protein n=1 Tax=Mucilaginibacter psychrotolerans TaxID=1524096 RepID=A0A4Y8S4E1_9SPHI|nr:hypothetical protein [Mucilaginibacter psychrotolerans]TFF33284.1 hypothetical protein E2R66_26765 [Mucilaginibacter psychrotolerans]